MLCVLFVLLMSAVFFVGSAHADTEEAPPYTAPSELAELREQNADVIAILNIPGTGICYPILQHPTEKDFYLNLTIDGEEGYPGSIYTNPIEGKDFSTFNTVIYGHNMRDGSYFGSLKSFRDEAFLAEHREIDIYTDAAKHSYDIFAVVVYGDRNIAEDFDDNSADDRAAFLKTLEHGGEGSILLDDVAVSVNSRIVTLSTCITDMHDNRLILVAVERDAEAPLAVPALPAAPVEPAEPDPYLS